MAGRERTVAWNLTARDNATPVMEKAAAAVDKLRAAQEKTAKHREATASLRDEISKLQSVYNRAAADVARFGAAMSANARNESLSAEQARQLRDAFGEAKARLAEARTEIARTSESLRSLTGVQRSASIAAQNQAVVLRANAVAQQRSAQAAAAWHAQLTAEKKALAESNAMMTARAAVMARLQVQSRAPGVRQRFNAGVDDFVAAMQTSGERGPLGLRGYELQNLSYQINDLFTQVASGTPITQAFAQQIGQIAHLFPNLVANAIKAAPALIGITAAVVPLISAFSRLRESTSILDEFTVKLAATADAGRMDPAQLLALVRSLENVGIAASDSRAAIASMIAEGANADEMEQMLRAARELSRVYGTELPDALSKVRSGFDGTYDSLANLDDSLNFLTAAQRTHIREMYEQGEASRANAEALGIFTDKMNEAADLATTEWSSAMNTLSGAWRNLLDWLGQTIFIEVAIEAVDGLGKAINMLVGSLRALGSIPDSVWLRALLPGGLTFGGGGGGDLGDFVPVEAAPVNLGDITPSEASKKQAEKAELERRDEMRKLYAKTDEMLGEVLVKGAEDRRKKVVEASRLMVDDLIKQSDDQTKRRVEQAKKESDALAAIDADNEQRRFQTKIAGMSERDAAIATAMRDAEMRAGAAGLELSEAQRAEIEATTGALWDQEEAQKAVNKASGGRKGDTAEKKEQKALEEALNNLLERRRLLMEQIEYQEDSGNRAGADELREQMVGVNEQIQTAIENMRAFWQRVGGPEAEVGLLKLRSFENELQAIEKQAVLSGKQANEMLADGVADGLDDVAESIAEGKLSISDFGRAFASMASDFLREIAQMIARQALLNALQRGQGEGGGVGGLLSTLVGSIFHTGGIVGAGAPGRLLPAAMFAAAPRYHGGGIAGLRSNEVAAVLERGEEVLTRNDPRHALNGGGGSTKIVNVLDSEAVVQHALASEAGERVMFNFISRNPAKIKGALGIG